MNVTVGTQPLEGVARAISSKSFAHRMLICAALADAPTTIECATTSDDIEATIACLTALGAKVRRDGQVLLVTPIDRTNLPLDVQMDCGESGSTLRFLVPVICALGCGATIKMHGRLPERPLSPLREELEAHGCAVSAAGTNPLVVKGQLVGGTFRLPGDVSSQFASGLLMALPLVGGESLVCVGEPVGSRPYIDMTLQVLERFGIATQGVRERDEKGSRLVWKIAADDALRSCGRAAVEGDWSNAAFWLCAGALCEKGVGVCGLDARSAQGDRAVLGALALFGADVLRTNELVAVRAGRPKAAELSVRDVPDLVPPLAAVAALAPGTSVLRDAGRLRLKESDRLESVSAALAALGAKVTVRDDDLVFEGVQTLHGGTVDACGDHRIAMLAAIAAARADGPVTIRGAECVSKSYPGFFDELAALGADVRWEGTCRQA